MASVKMLQGRKLLMHEVLMAVLEKIAGNEPEKFFTVPKEFISFFYLDGI